MIFYTLENLFSKSTQKMDKDNTLFCLSRFCDVCTQKLDKDNICLSNFCYVSFFLKKKEVFSKKSHIIDNEDKAKMRGDMEIPKKLMRKFRFFLGQFVKINLRKENFDFIMGLLRLKEEDKPIWQEYKGKVVKLDENEKAKIKDRVREKGLFLGLLISAKSFGTNRDYDQIVDWYRGYYGRKLEKELRGKREYEEGVKIANEVGRKVIKIDDYRS